jgi:hypothetical protein
MIASRLHAALGAEAAETAVIGVRWPSDPGPARRWIRHAVLHRFSRAFGLPGGPRDPYYTIAWRAQGVGRRGLRQLIFGLQDAFPGTEVHLLTHSLGARVAMNALAPDLTPDRQDGRPAFLPGRELRVRTIVLAGADLDTRLFLRGNQAPAAAAALARADLWWFTLPEPGTRDRVLVLRDLHVGRRPIGNGGPRFAPGDADRLLREGRLILDVGRVPEQHSQVEYYRRERIAALAGALTRPGTVRVATRLPVGEEAARIIGYPAAAATRSVVATVHEILASPATPAALAPYLADPAVTVQLYAAWKLTAAAQEPQQVWRAEFNLSRALHLIRRARAAAAP